MTIGAINAGSVYYGQGRYRGCQIYDDGVLVRDFIPCQDPNGVAGMYDTLNNKFYANAGTGDFVTGEVKETTDVYIKGTDASGNSLVNSHLIISGEANRCIEFIIDRLGLSGLFVADEKASGVHISDYKFHRYCKGYDGLKDMLADNGAKLRIAWNDRVVRLSAEPIADYTESPIDDDEAVLTVEQHNSKVNHLVCLGSGNLAEREVIHLYLDPFGGIGDTQYYTGLAEIADTYDNSNAEDLRTEGVKRFMELLDIDSSEITMNESTDVVFDIGDIVGSTDITTGVSVSATVTQKIVKINNGFINIEYKTGR
jgi:hypothetical protein